MVALQLERALTKLVLLLSYLHKNMILTKE